MMCFFFKKKTHISHHRVSHCLIFLTANDHPNGLMIFPFVSPLCVCISIYYIYIYIYVHIDRLIDR